MSKEVNVTRCISLNAAENIVELKKNGEILQYTFDNCFDSDASQAEVFSKEIEPLLPNLLRGINSTIFCYGMTGAGKTHTMQGTEVDPGIIPRAVAKLFEYIQDRTRNYKMFMSYFELYNNNIYDLINLNSTPLPIREDNQKNIFIPNLKLVAVSTMGEFQKTYSTACKNRKVGPTMLNSQSSRSHAILRITLECQTGSTKIVGKLHMIDLAGSEDNRQTNNSGVRMLESTKINSSLFALGKVVEALNKGEARIPYRENKLTRLLQDSLGGNAQGLVIANVSPSINDFTNSRHALNFASKSRLVVNTPVVQVEQEAPKVVKNMDPKKKPPPTQRTALPNSSMNKLYQVSDVMSIVEKLVDDKLQKEKLKMKAENEVDIEAKLTAKFQNLVNKIEIITLENQEMDSLDETPEAIALLTPKTRKHRAKRWIGEGKSVKVIDYQRSCYCYERAFALLPDNEKLKQKVYLQRQKLAQMKKSEEKELEQNLSEEPEQQSSEEYEDPHPKKNPQPKKQLKKLESSEDDSSSDSSRKENRNSNVKKLACSSKREEKKGAGRKKEVEKKHPKAKSKRSRTESESASSSSRSEESEGMDICDDLTLESVILKILNNSDKDGLMELVTVGSTRAETILELRESKGPWKKLSDLSMSWVLKLPEKNEDNFENLRTLIK
uniref:Kinesin-like protein n=1 Tax=Arcella intermedia TaxID=1963864 RepID=A0A6B2KZ33_9EUKA